MSWTFSILVWGLIGVPVKTRLYISFNINILLISSGGGGGIRTHEEREPLPVFKTGPFNHSGTHPTAGNE